MVIGDLPFHLKSSHLQEPIQIDNALGIWWGETFPFIPLHIGIIVSDKASLRKLYCDEFIIRQCGLLPVGFGSRLTVPAISYSLKLATKRFPFCCNLHPLHHICGIVMSIQKWVSASCHCRVKCTLVKEIYLLLDYPFGWLNFLVYSAVQLLIIF